MKKALLIGINYKNTDHELNGCINDVLTMGNLLETKFNYKTEYLTDDTDIKPTKDNIICAFNSLLDGTNSTDTLLIYFSGHGTTTKDKNNDELDDKLDEAIYTLDNKIILDDEINNIIITKNIGNSIIKLFFDCCHSGTILDLEYNIKYIKNNDDYDLIENKTKINQNISVFSGCLDSQSSSDSKFNKSLYKEYKNYGAFTYSLLEVLYEVGDLKISNKNLLKLLTKKLIKKNFTQIPHFSCSKLEMLNDVFL